MNNDEIKSILVDAFSSQEVYISKNGNHFQIIVVSEIFYGMNRIQKQQAIYAPLTKYIMDNHIHALSIKAYTPKEWKLNQKLNILKTSI